MKHWNAFCTIHWFATGNHSVAMSRSQYTNDLYFWYLAIEDKFYV